MKTLVECPTQQSPRGKLRNTMNTSLQLMTRTQLTTLQGEYCPKAMEQSQDWPRVLFLEIVGNAIPLTWVDTENIFHAR